MGNWIVDSIKRGVKGIVFAYELAFVLLFVVPAVIVADIVYGIKERVENA